MNNNALDITEQKSVFDTLKTHLGQTLDPNLQTIHATYSGIPSGFTDLDKTLNGFQNGQLTTIAVRPGIGKTSFILSLLNNMGICLNKKVSLFSLERTADKIVQRMVESATGLAVPKINAGKIDINQKMHVKSVLKNMETARIHIEDNPHILLEEIIDKCKALKEEGTEIILIDYLELIGTNIQKPECNDSELCVIMSELQKVAQEINIPLVVFSQLGTQLFSNEFKYTPDEVNRNSDTLLFINRPDYYHINHIEQKEKGVAELTIVKAEKLTEAKVITLKFIESLDRFENLN